MKKLIISSLAALLVTGTATAGTASKPEPKVSMKHAREMALKLAPGHIKSSEYEKEGGVWRYSFDIQQKGHIQEIGIDAMTGKVVENSNEGKVDHD
jgi:uncharacterized membrane protein YkoI